MTGPLPAPRIREVDVGGLRLHCRESGPLDGTPVMVLHGIMGHGREWDPVVDALAGRHRVVTIDQRGHGQSAWAPPETYTVDTLASDLWAVVARLELGRVHLVGHSMGAMVALVAAAGRPDSVGRLTLLDVGPDALEGPAVGDLSESLEHLSTASYATVDEAVDEWAAGNPLARREHLTRYVADALRRRDDDRLVWRFDALGLRSFLHHGTSSDQLWRAVDAVRAPTLLVRGAQSPVLSSSTAAAMVERLADARLVEIPDAGHDLGVEAPEAVAAAVLAFLPVD